MALNASWLALKKMYKLGWRWPDKLLRLSTVVHTASSACTTSFKSNPNGMIGRPTLLPIKSIMRIAIGKSSNVKADLESLNDQTLYQTLLKVLLCVIPISFYSQGNQQIRLSRL